MMIIALVMGAFGLFLILLAALLINEQRKNRDELRQIDRGVGRVVDTLRSPQELARRRARRKRIEREKQEAFDLHDDGT